MALCSLCLWGEISGHKILIPERRELRIPVSPYLPYFSIKNNKFSLFILHPAVAGLPTLPGLLCYE